MTKPTRKDEKTAGRPDSAREHEDLEDEIEEDVEELAATFGAGPKAAPAPEGPMEGQQYAP
jgi:hypothetical protein